MDFLPDNAWPSGRWAIECVDIVEETHDVKSFHFRLLPGEEGQDQLCFHRPGQFVTLRFRHGDTLVPRSYTISSSPSRPLLMSLSIKRDPIGLVSRYMHDQLKCGDQIAINGPGGTFDLISVNPKPKIALMTGGVGITPAMSVLRYIHDVQANDIDVAFVHSARTPDDIVFRDECALVARRRGVAVHYVCEQGAPSGMEQGYLTSDSLERLVPDILSRTVMCCGPTPYMDAVKAMLAEIGYDMSQYHEESFGDPTERQNPEGATPETLVLEPVAVQSEAADATTAKPDREIPEGAKKIVFSQSGKTAEYNPGETILEVATREGIAIATNCQMGLCGTCKAKCTSGAVSMDDTEGLEDGEEDAGFVLTCCARPQGPVEIEL